jgi:hypothetical protein
MQRNGVPDATTVIDKLGFMFQPISAIHLTTDIQGNCGMSMLII